MRNKTNIMPLFDAKGQVPLTDAQRYAYQQPFYVQVFCQDGKLIVADESDATATAANTQNAIFGEKWFYATSH